MSRVLTPEQQTTYDYVMEKCEAHFMPNKKLYTAHITLGYDHQKYGNSEWEAKDTLATCLSVQEHIQEIVTPAKTPTHE